MLGSVADAEDMVQETFVRWQQSTDDEIRSPKAFLTAQVFALYSLQRDADADADFSIGADADSHNSA